MLEGNFQELVLDSSFMSQGLSCFCHYATYTNRSLLRISMNPQSLFPILLVGVLGLQLHAHHLASYVGSKDSTLIITFVWLIFLPKESLHASLVIRCSLNKYQNQLSYSNIKCFPIEQTEARSLYNLLSSTMSDWKNSSLCYLLNGKRILQ